jgi:phosphatidate cytidylyltransferase
VVTTAQLLPYVVGALVLGGVAVLLSRQRELIKRWCAWMIGVPIVVGALWLGPPGAAAIAGVAGTIAALEYGPLARLTWPDRVVLTVAVDGLVLAAWLAPAYLPRVAAAGALALAGVALLSGDASDGARRLAFGVLGLAWLAPLAGIVPLGATGLALILAVSIGDIAAAQLGPRLGGPRLSPLSPGKHWSGTVAGSLAGIGVLALIGGATVPMMIAVAVGGPAGDLLQSMIKRGAGVKDAGRWIPGSGGLLDRVDSLLIALALVLVLSS